MNELSDLSFTIKPKSDQLNNEQLMAGPITIKVTNVDVVDSDQQPIIIHYENQEGRPYKPSKTFRKVIIALWGKDGNEWIGRSMTLFRNPETMFGKEKTGGIEISHVTHIENTKEIIVTKTRGKMRTIIVRPLVIKQAAEPAEITAPTESELSAARYNLADAASYGMAKLVESWKSVPAAIRAIIGPKGCPDEYKQAAKEADNATIAAQSTTTDDEY